MVRAAVVPSRLSQVSVDAQTPLHKHNQHPTARPDFKLKTHLSYLPNMSSTTTATIVNDAEVKHRNVPSSSPDPAPSAESVPLLPSKDAIIRSTNIYSVPLTLIIYDYWVLGFVTRFAWRCPTTTHLLPFFRSNVGAKHLDVGVGTGYYLCNADIPKDGQVTLVDLSQDSLDKAATRFNRPETTTAVLHDIFEPLPAELGDYDSISMFYLLHCLPGTMAEKCSIFGHLQKRLREGGCVYGATILGSGVQHNGFGNMILNYGHQEGFFCNRDDSEESLAGELGKYFEQVETRVVGTICLFKGSKPKTQVITNSL